MYHQWIEFQVNDEFFCFYKYFPKVTIEQFFVSLSLKHTDVLVYGAEHKSVFCELKLAKVLQ